MKPEVLTTGVILRLPAETRDRLRDEIATLIPRAFPRMEENQWKGFVEDFFTEPGGGIERRVFLYRGEGQDLLGAALFDHGEISIGGREVTAIYILTRAVDPDSQAAGLGKKMAEKILMELRPDLLFTTCTQSASLHSWVSLPEKGLVGGYEVFPRLERREDGDHLVSLPREDQAFILGVFERLYLGVARGEREALQRALRGLSGLMVRKDMYSERYDFDPWKKQGREDDLAVALGVGNRDGVLVVFRREG